jgi:rhamnulokinase
MNLRGNIFCIAIDMGASNIRIMLGEVGTGTLKCSEISRFQNSIIERDGHERWDIEYILQEIITGLNRASPSGGIPIVSLGVDAWGVDFALLDGDGRLMNLPVAYRDHRTAGMEEKWSGLMSREETFRRTGINFYIFNTLFQLLSLKGTEGLAAASRILFLPSYVLSRLCGRGMNELTISSTSQLLNAGSGAWDPQIIAQLGIRKAVLGKVCMPGTILGKVNHPNLEMPDCDVIAVCSHDTASAVVAVPFEKDSTVDSSAGSSPGTFAGSSVFISTGTWCIVGIESGHPVLTTDALEGGFTNERGYGGSYRCLKNIVGLWLVQGLMKSLPVVDDYDSMESLAMNYSGPVPVIDPGDPLLYNPANMREAFDGYFMKTGQELPSGPGGYFRSAYDSLICSFRYNIEKIEQMTGKAITTVHLIGGGCQSRYLMRRTAALCRRKVISGPVEAAAIGNILVQAIAKGIIPGLQEARDLVRRTQSVRTFEPEMQETGYEAYYRKFLQMTAGE